MRFAICLLLALSACAPETANHAATGCPESGIAVSDGWIRAAPQGQPMSAAYMTICSAASDRLTGARIDGVAAAELHISAMNADNVASMARASDGIALSAGEPVALAPGGTHIMLIGVENGLAAGGFATITLEFENAGARDVEFEIRDATTAHAH